MATTKYVNAELAIPINSAKQTVPKRQRWPAVKKVLRAKGKPTEEIPNVNRFELHAPEPDFLSTLTPLYQCFSETQSIIKLLEDLKRKDSELATILEAEYLNRGSHAHRQTLDEDAEITFEIGGPTNDVVPVNSYVDFLTSFVGLFLRSRFLTDYKDIARDHDPHEILSTLADVQCPGELGIFKRLFVNPYKKFHEGETTEQHNGIPLNHLAKFLDVVVVSLLSSVTENTSPAVVCWLLDYLISLLKELFNSLSLLGSPGWYGAPPIRSRKRTATSRPSISRPFVLAPPVVVVGTPPSSPSALRPPLSLILDPETGQHSPHPSLSFRNQRSLLNNNPHGGGGGASPTFHRPHSPLFNSNRTPQDAEQVPPRLELSTLRNLLDTSSRERTPPGRSIRSASPPGLGSIQENSIQEDFKTDSDRSRSPSPAAAEEEVKSKVKSSTDIPQVDKEHELRTGVTSEGRVSLLAILTAISDLPQSDILWNYKQLGEKCFSLIQFCLDLGLPPKIIQGNVTQTAQSRRQKFQARDNPVFSILGRESPSDVHTKLVVDVSVRALIQCATSLWVGCVNEGTACSLRYLRLPFQNNSSHHILTRLLQRIDDHSPATFRKALAIFSEPSNSTARKLFHFLHVILQYCSSDSLGNDNLKVDVVVGVLRAAVDRIVELDITEPSIQNVSAL